MTKCPNTQVRQWHGNAASFTGYRLPDTAGGARHPAPVLDKGRAGGYPCPLEKIGPNYLVISVSENVDLIAAERQRRRDAECVRLALRGELTAFDELIGRYQRRATAVAFRLLSNRDDAMEVVQDAFLKAYGSLASLSKPERFGAWLMTIVSNLSLNRRRSRALRRAASLEQLGEANDEGRGGANLPDEGVEAPEAAMAAADVKTLIDRALAELPELQRQALVMFSMGKMPQKDVADALGCSVEAVKWHVFTARKKLKEKLKDYL